LYLVLLRGGVSDEADVVAQAEAFEKGFHEGALRFFDLLDYLSSVEAFTDIATDGDSAEKKFVLSQSTSFVAKYVVDLG